MWYRQAKSSREAPVLPPPYEQKYRKPLNEEERSLKFRQLWEYKNNGDTRQSDPEVIKGFITKAEAFLNHTVDVVQFVQQTLSTSHPLLGEAATLNRSKNKELLENVHNRVMAGNYLFRSLFEEAEMNFLYQADPQFVTTVKQAAKLFENSLTNFWFATSQVRWHLLKNKNGIRTTFDQAILDLSEAIYSLKYHIVSFQAILAHMKEHQHLPISRYPVTSDWLELVSDNPVEVLREPGSYDKDRAAEELDRAIGVV